MTRGSGSKVRQNYPEVIVIGAGIAGLTAAALLAGDGVRVQVIERHTVPGGCASYYMRGGYRFDVGATLVSGFGPRGVHRLLFERLGMQLEAAAVEPAMEVRVGGDCIRRYGDERWYGATSPARARSISPMASRQSRWRWPARCGAAAVRSPIEPWPTD